VPAWAGALPQELADVEEAAAFWHGSPAVRRRIDAIAGSSASVVLFLEHLPLGLADWLARQVAMGEGAAASAIDLVARELVTAVAFMNGAGVLHFDAHLGNLRTDGQRVFMTDFGLATCPRFMLSPAEARFLAANDTHDACYAITRLVDWLVTALTDITDWQDRDRYVRRCADGEAPIDLPAPARVIVNRYAPVAAAINEFYRRLHLEDRATPYPTEDAERACAHAGLLGRL